MLRREEAIAACLEFPDSFEDYPFDDPNWTTIRRRTNRKIFALIFERNGKIWLNLKAEPLKADFWRDAYTAVVTGYHMNKRHWISVILDGSMQDEEIRALIEDSYALTADKKRQSGGNGQ